MPLLSDYARHKKRRFFLDRIPRGARVLEVGCGDGWVGDYLRGRTRYEGIDIVPPADIVGDIRNWKALGLSANTYDAIVAFELIEHVDAWDAFRSLLKVGGVLMVTTPLPRMDWLLRLLERVGLNQSRTSAA